MPGPKAEQQRQYDPVEKRLAQIGLNLPKKVYDATDGTEVHKPVQALPATATQAPHHCIGRCHRQRYQQQETRQSYHDVFAIEDIAHDKRPGEELIKRDVRNHVQTGVEEGKQPEHAPQPDQPVPAGKVAQWRDRKHNQQQA